MNKHGPTCARAKPTIGLDLNGVILNNGRLKERLSQIRFKKRISAGEFTFKVVVQERGLLTGEEYRELQKLIYDNDFIGRRMPLVPGIKKYLPRLYSLGKLIIVTSNYGASLKLGLELLNHYRLTGYFDEIRHTLPGLNKSDLIKNLDLDFYLDDDPHKLEDLIGLVPRLFLLDYQHNHEVDCSAFAIRVDSISSFYHLIKGLVHEDGTLKQGLEPCSPKHLVSCSYS